MLGRSTRNAEEADEKKVKCGEAGKHKENLQKVMIANNDKHKREIKTKAEKATKENVQKVETRKLLKEQAAEGKLKRQKAAHDEHKLKTQKTWETESKLKVEVKSKRDKSNEKLTKAEENGIVGETKKKVKEKNDKVRLKRQLLERKAGLKKSRFTEKRNKRLNRIKEITNTLRDYRLLMKKAKSYNFREKGIAPWLPKYDFMTTQQLQGYEINEFNAATSPKKPGFCVRTDLVRQDRCKTNKQGCESGGPTSVKSNCALQPTAKISTSKGTKTVYFSGSVTPGKSGTCYGAHSCTGSLLETKPRFLRACGAFRFAWKAEGGSDWAQVIIAIKKYGKKTGSKGTIIRTVIYRVSKLTRFTTGHVWIPKAMGAGKYSVVFYTASYDRTNGEAIGTKVQIQPIIYQNFVRGSAKDGCDVKPFAIERKRKLKIRTDFKLKRKRERKAKLAAKKKARVQYNKDMKTLKKTSANEKVSKKKLVKRLRSQAKKAAAADVVETAVKKGFSELDVKDRAANGRENAVKKTAAQAKWEAKEEADALHLKLMEADSMEQESKKKAKAKAITDDNAKEKQIKKKFKKHLKRAFQERAKQQAARAGCACKKATPIPKDCTCEKLDQAVLEKGARLLKKAADAVSGKQAMKRHISHMGDSWKDHELSPHPLKSKIPSGTMNSPLAP